MKIECPTFNRERPIDEEMAFDLQDLLGYTEWRNFSLVIEKAKVVCRDAGQDEGDHFVNVNKMVPLPKGAADDEKPGTSG